MSPEQLLSPEKLLGEFDLVKVSLEDVASVISHLEFRYMGDWDWLLGEMMVGDGGGWMDLCDGGGWMDLCEGEGWLNEFVMVAG